MILVFAIIPLILLTVVGITYMNTIIRTEISSRSYNTLSVIEQEINGFLGDMLMISNILINNPDVRSVLTSNEPAFETMKRLDDTSSSILNFVISGSDARVTYIDHQGRYFTNWSQNFNDYSFIGSLPIITRAKQSLGHVVWSSFHPSYILEEATVGPSYFSLARSMELGPAEEGGTGVFLLSISEEVIKHILSKHLTSKNEAIFLKDNTGSVLTGAGSSEMIDRSDNLEYAELEQFSQNIEYVQSNNSTYIVVSRLLQQVPTALLSEGWSVTAYFNYNRIAANIQRITAGLSIAVIGIFILTTLLSALFTRQIVKPIQVLSTHMSNWNIHRPMNLPETKQDDEVGQLYNSFTRMDENIRKLFTQLDLEHKARERYRYQSLRARINPHFLFNTLATVRWMALIRKADNIVDTLDAISHLLEFSMAKGDGVTTLAEELNCVNKYVQIQNTRFGGRFCLEYNIPDHIQNRRILRFILQPVVENSILHGYATTQSRGLIKIEASVFRDTLCISVIDHGKGMEQDEIFKAIYQDNNCPDTSSCGIGLSVIHSMLTVLFGPDYGVSIASNNGTTVTLTLPVSEKLLAKASGD